MAAIPTQTILASLQTRIQGAVITPEDARYDAARKAWNLSVQHRPALIIEANSTADVVEAVRFAREMDLGIAVQSTGHGVVRPADDSLLIITSPMTNIHIDAQARTAWIEAGAKWGMVLEKAQMVGLAPLLGSSPGVGVVGYTLGGGMGWLARKYGLAIDSVLFFELVTPDGERVRASQTENSDLFWGLRGGGGNFGVVTGMQIRLYPVTTVYGGTLIYPAAVAKEVFTLYRDWISAVPDEMMSSIAIMNMPPIPQVPEFLRGQSVVMVNGCYVGPVEEGEMLVQGWLEWMAPIANSFRAMPFSEVGSISNDPKDPLPGYSTGAWLRDLSDEAIDIIVRYGVSNHTLSPLVKTEIRHAGGAMARVAADANAYGNREATLILNMIGMTPTPEARQQFEQYTGQMKRDLSPMLTGGVYMNFLEGREARERTQDAYRPEAFQRLMVIKAQYDPENRFRHSFDIPPAESK